MNYVLEGLKPERFWHYFEEISRIPRGSGNEKGIADYLVAFAEKHGLYVYTDSIHNVFMRKEASKGYEDAEPLLLQGHTDMVCEKNADSDHDFMTDPIKLIVEDGWVRADGTTLGADNGNAVAYMLACLEDDELVHPELECLFTTNEEVGLDGAKEFDGSIVKSKRMINLDCGGEGTVTTSSAGGMVLNAVRKMDMIPFTGSAIRIFVTGLAGGHSGGKINEYLGNSNKIMGRILKAIGDVSIVSINGGSKDNAIPRECEAICSVRDAEKAKAVIAKMEETIRKELGDADSAFRVITEDVVDPVLMADPDDSQKIIDFICIAFNGVLWMSHSIPGLVEASSNLGVITTKNEEVKITFSPRASIDSLNDESEMRIETLCRVMGFEFSSGSHYPSWEFMKDSPLRQMLLDIYKKQTGSEMKIRAVHGGLETGIFSSKIPGIDIVAIGPDAEGAHSPDERVNISSVERVYIFLREVIETCAKGM